MVILFIFYFYLFVHFISFLMYSLGTDVTVQVIIGEPLKALMLLCRGNLSRHICYCALYTITFSTLRGFLQQICIITSVSDKLPLQVTTSMLLEVHQ